jgi:hypothetical protein
LLLSILFLLIFISSIVRIRKFSLTLIGFDTCPFFKLIISFSICFDKEVSFTHPILPPILAVSALLKIFAVAAKPTFSILYKISL